MTRLLRSLFVAARWFAPLSFKGFRHSAWLGRISPPGWSLLPGASALTRTGLPPARTTRLSGRTMPSHLPPHKHDQSKAPSLQRVVLHAFIGTMDPSDSLPAPQDFSHRPYTHGLCPTRLPGRVSPVPHCSFPTCHRLRPRGGPASVPVQDAVYCLRRDMSGSALPNTFRLII